MTREERRRRMQTILDQHNEASRLARQASAEFLAGSRATIEAHRSIEAAAIFAEQAHGHVLRLTAMILSANEAAMALWNEVNDDDPNEDESQ